MLRRSALSLWTVRSCPCSPLRPSTDLFPSTGIETATFKGQPQSEIDRLLHMVVVSS